MADQQHPTDPGAENGADREIITNSDQSDALTNQDAAADKTESQPANSPNPDTTSTQGNMGDGAGIRGDYGDSSQTNGMEGEDGSDMSRAAEAGGESEYSGK